MGTKTTNPSRRTLLRGALASAVTVQIAEPAGATGTDAELVRLAAEHQAIGRRLDDLTMPYVDVVESWPRSLQPEIDRLVLQHHEMAEAAANIPAATMDGMKAKCRIMLDYMQQYSDGALIWGGHDELLGWSLARDILGAEAAIIVIRQDSEDASSAAEASAGGTS